MTGHRLVDPLLLDVLNWSPLDEDVRDPALRDVLHAAVDELPEDERTVINGMFWEQLSSREIGRQMGIARSMVKTLQARAMEHLEALLLDFEGDPE